MRAGREECDCPLCDGPAQAAELIGLDTQRIECPNCTTYQISDALRKLLAAVPAPPRMRGAVLEVSLSCPGNTH
jgi:hypothetical protein